MRFYLKRNLRDEAAVMPGIGQIARSVILIVAVSLIALIATFACPLSSHAQTSAPASDTRELVVGTKAAPPFAMRAEDGSWRGIGIDLWRRIAEATHLRYRFEETTLENLTAGVADGSLDLAVAALTVTAPRFHAVDFTLPFFSTGLGIAVANDSVVSWWPVATNILSLGFLRAVAVLFAVALVVGIVLWFFERRRNEHFGMHRQGLGSSL